MSKLNIALVRIDFCNGMTQEQLVEKYSTHKQAIYNAVKDLARALADIERAKRDGEFIELFTKQAKTLQEIGEMYGISRERVRQRLEACGVDKEIGGASLKSVIKKIHTADKPNKAEVKCFNYFGCSLEYRNKYGKTNEKGSLPYAYINQKKKAKQRDIPFELTFPEWVEIWQESGHLFDRGLGDGKYVMARLCDTGPYSKDNVVIITHNENSREARLMDKVYKRPSAVSDESALIKALAIKHNIKEGTLYNRVHHLGWDINKAISTPVKPWNRETRQAA